MMFFHVPVDFLYQANSAMFRRIVSSVILLCIVNKVMLLCIANSIVLLWIITVLYFFE